MSRVAKLERCAQHGCAAISLQHDGVVVRLTADWSAAGAAVGLSAAVFSAVGYAQLVEVKPGLRALASCSWTRCLQGGHRRSSIRTLAVGPRVWQPARA